MPLLFTAPKPSLPVEPTTQETGGQEGEGEKEEEDVENDRGAYAEGVYVAPPPSTGVTSAPGPQQPRELDDQKPYPEAQASYHNLLRHRFLLLRSTLKCAPPVAAISALDESHPISFPRHSVAAKKDWRRFLLGVDPQMAQLACMDMDSVLGVLGIMARLMSENFRSGDVERVRRIGAWAWGLLGKCREAGQLGTEAVGEIRDLGKRAVKILQKMKEDEESRWAMREEESVSSEDEQAGSGEVAPEGIAAEGSGHADAMAGELKAAKARLQASLQAGDREPIAEGEAAGPLPATDTSTKMETETDTTTTDLAGQTHAMLDMIITVVGEFYGQRDLLQAREIWSSN